MHIMKRLRKISYDSRIVLRLVIHGIIKDEMEMQDDELVYRIQNELLPECDVYCTIKESLSSSLRFCDFSHPIPCFDDSFLCRQVSQRIHQLSQTFNQKPLEDNNYQSIKSVVGDETRMKIDITAIFMWNAECHSRSRPLNPRLWNSFLGFSPRALEMSTIKIWNLFTRGTLWGSRHFACDDKLLDKRVKTPMTFSVDWKI